jgi:hypothetical protein
VGSRTLSTWNSCACHLCIIFVNTQRDQSSPEVGIGCTKLGKAVGMWLWPSGTPMESILQKSTPHHGLSMVDFSGWLSLSFSC